MYKIKGNSFQLDKPTKFELYDFELILNCISSQP